MTGEQLMGAILQSALQGKLVEQRPEEGTGEELYKIIKAEKERLIKADLLKKTKSSEAITEDEKPFDIPVSWKWTRIEDIAILNPKNDLDDALDTSFIPMTLVSDAFSNRHTSVRRKWGEIKKGFSHFAEGDIGVAKITPCFQNRKSVIFKNLINGYGAGTTELTIVRPLKRFCCPKYLLYLFKSELFIKSGMKSFTGTAGQQRIHKDFLRRFVMPLPPLDEQERIVARIEELVPLVEQYTAKSEKLNALNASFPEMMKKSILQEAVQGRLVPQDPNDEPASVLLKKIAEEKKRLVREGKIKKQKPLPEITEEEVPFEVPEGWEWVRFNDIMNTVSTGPFGSMLHKTDYESTGIPIVNPIHMRQGRIIPSSNSLVSKKTAERLTPYKLHTRDIVFARRGDIGRSAVVHEAENGWICGTGSFFASPPAGINPEFVSLMFSTPYVRQALLGESVGTTMNNLNQKILLSFLFPLPPKKEQQRIIQAVKKIDTMINVFNSTTLQ